MPDGGNIFAQFAPQQPQTSSALPPASSGAQQPAAPEIAPGNIFAQFAQQPASAAQAASPQGQPSAKTQPASQQSMPMVAPHPAPDGSGGWTNLSDANYKTLMAQAAQPGAAVTSAPIALSSSPQSPAAAPVPPSVPVGAAAASFPHAAQAAAPGPSPNAPQPGAPPAPLAAPAQVSGYQLLKVPTGGQPSPTITPSLSAAAAGAGNNPAPAPGDPRLAAGRSVMGASNGAPPTLNSYSTALAQAQAQEGTGMLAGTARSMTNGLMFGFAPEVKGGIAAGEQYLSNATGMSGPNAPTPGQAYTATAATVRQRAQQFAQQHPYANFAASLYGGAPLAGGEGALIEAAPKLIGAAPGFASIASKIGASIGLGGLSGAASGAGAAGPGRRAAGAEVGGTIGAGIGAAVPALGLAARGATNLGRNLMRPGPTADSAAQRWLSGEMTRTGATPASISAKAAGRDIAAGGQSVAEALGKNAQGTAVAYTRAPGTAADLARPLTERAEGTAERLTDHFAQTTGVDPNTAAQEAERALASGRDSVNPAYAAIRANPEPVTSPALSTLLETDPHVQRALATVRANTRAAPASANAAPALAKLTDDQDVQDWMGKLFSNDPRALAAIGVNDAPAATPDAAMWLRVRQQLADDVERDPNSGKPLPSDKNWHLNKAAGDLTDALKEQIPGFREAQAAAELYKAPAGAYAAAGGYFGSKATTKSAGNFQQLWDSASTPGERQAIKLRLAADLAMKGETDGLTPRVLQGTRVQKILSTAFGPEAAKRIADNAEAEGGMMRYSARVNPEINSPTGGINAHLAEDPMKHVAELLEPLASHGLVHGNVGAGLVASGLKAVGMLKSKATLMGNQHARDALSQYLMMPASDFDAFVQKMTQKGAARPSPIGSYASAAAQLAGRSAAAPVVGQR